MELTAEPKVSQNWGLDNSGTPKVFHINSVPVLSVQSNLPEDVFKEDADLAIEVKSGSKTEHSKATVEGVNFPVSIKDFPSDQVITLPANASNIEIPLEVGTFFTGNIAEYSISCPFCSDPKIELETAFELNKNISNLTAAVDYAEVAGFGLVVLTNNRLVLLDADY